MEFWGSGLIALASAILAVWWLGVAVTPLVLAMALGWVWHVRTFHRDLPSPRQFLPVYGSALAWHGLHLYEEYTYEFYTLWPEMAGVPAWHAGQFLSFNLVFDGLFVLSGVAVALRIRMLSYWVSFLVVGTFVTAIGHIVVAAWLWEYFPGVATAPGSIAFGAIVGARMSACRTVRGNQEPHRGTPS